ncbi:MAG: hypothetical protein COU08_04295 [Candidatus Harrisonbacteria bacterium CG10_big_fil_rev_8_21_14_0_10_42_17]|uniref:UDP-N-acetylmuramoyl-tripeptide--D-alanyl-D-alanine ligase n=1 Tax=Candidatus Harrisonbacteria bacterium CG10_big_fil_rev_8_21_14_0_10_42_17 TaxID=1974584 RepID=A0A2M6WH34_9BACT|nr:MAG: hypothetical protein COU08_04295 [Candidatus Harrisonbacteria bacterium CG10_big_fil_rev_8_21_14_0_10_42_17]
MKKRALLKWILRTLARKTIQKYEPLVIGITGSVGKTSTKTAIGVVLTHKFNTRFSQESHNNEFGFPLGIIASWSKKELKLVSKEEPGGVRRIRKVMFYATAIGRGVLSLLFGNKKRYPEQLVLEYGADKPGDIDYLLNIARPEIAVVSAIGKVPVHVEHYENPEAVAYEKGKLVSATKKGGKVILNYDDEYMHAMSSRTKNEVITFGTTEGAMMRFLNVKTSTNNLIPTGITFDLEYRGASTSVQLKGCLGSPHAYAAAAAAAVGVALNMKLAEIAEALKEYKAIRHRMEIKKGVEGSIIIDDSYNASPLSTRAALEAVKQLSAKRKIGVLGDMLEIGSYATKEHEVVGRHASDALKIIVTIGTEAHHIVEGAIKNGTPKENIKSVETIEEAENYLKNLIKEGDLVLIKASRAIGLERLVERLTLKEKH